MIGVKVTGLDFAEQKLGDVIEGLFDLSGLSKKIGEAGEEQTRQRFHDQIDPDGIPWAELQPETIKRKNKSTDKLKHNLDLIKSITFTPTNAGVFIHSSLPNERVAPHQFGDDSRNLPQRAIFGSSLSDRGEFQDTAIKWLEGLF